MADISSFSCVPFQYEIVTPLITKYRVRLFYLGLNRNGGYITKEYAEGKLLPSLPYTPVIGDYSEEDGDFTTHREKNIARAYGLVPQEPNVRWEPHLDNDGIERTYACCDVYLWTGRFDKANEIVGKPHSLELMPSSIQGSWKLVNGMRRGFEYTDGIFLGLSVLGENVEPCFEGAAFYSLLSQFNNFMQENYEKYTGGKEDMINYRLNADEKYKSLFCALNPSFNEEGEWAYDKEIVSYSENSAITYVPADDKFFVSAYSISEDSVIEFGEATEVQLHSFTAEEWEAIETKIAEYATLKGSIDTFANDITTLKNTITENTTTIETVKADFERVNGEKSELENTISTLEIEKATLAESNARLEEELNALKAEKAAFELAQKTEKLNSYKSYISDKTYLEIQEKLTDFSMVDLEKELAYYSLKEKPELLSNQFVPTGYTTSTVAVSLEDKVNATLDSYKDKV